MSYLTGTLSGALVAGSLYYGFSTLIQGRTQSHVSDLHRLSTQLAAPPSDTIPAPIPAVERITHKPFESLLKGRWNQQVDTLYKSAGEWDKNLSSWTRKVFYGGDETKS